MTTDANDPTQSPESNPAQPDTTAAPAAPAAQAAPAAPTEPAAAPAAAAPAQAAPAATDSKGATIIDQSRLDILDEVSIVISIEIGRKQIKIRDLLNLTKDSIIDLDKLAGEPMDIYANGKLISKGNIITANGKYCVRLVSIPEKKV